MNSAAKSIRYTQIMPAKIQPFALKGLVGICFLSFMTGCATTDVVQPATTVQPAQTAPEPTSAPAPTTPSRPTLKLKDLAVSEPETSAQAFLLRALNASRQDRTLLHLAAAKRYLEAGRYDPASLILDLVRDTTGDPWITHQRLLLTAALELGLNRPGKSLRELARLAEANLDTNQEDTALYLTLRAHLAREDVAAALTSIDRFIERTEDTTRIIDPANTVIEHVAQFSVLQFASLAQELSADPQHLAWLALARTIAQEGWQPEKQRIALMNWIEDHPSHSAYRFARHRVDATCVPNPSASIALILPLSSPFRDAAIAFEEGFSSRLLADGTTASIAIKAYDFGDDFDNAKTLYDQAVDEGATFIVGPLGREAVASLSSYRAMPVPTLLIGHDEAAPRSRAFSLDLSREREALDLVEHAWQRGFRHALFLYGSEKEKQDIAQFAAAAWVDHGGVVIDSVIIPNTTADHTELLSRLFRLGLSEQTNDEMQRLTGGNIALETDTEIRPDLDLILLFTDSATARLLKPQIDFYKASGIPVYSQNVVFEGRPDPVNDLDLEGILFSDMPWMVRAGLGWESSEPDEAPAMPRRGSPLSRFFALGADAYLLACQLLEHPNQSRWRIGGVSGTFQSTTNGQINRSSDWVIYKGGALEAFAPALVVLKGRF